MVIRRSIIVAGVVLILGLISVGAGIAAELTRVKASQIRIENGECVHPNSPAMGLAITAAVALLLMRIIVKLATGRGYSCCRFHPNIPKLIRYCIIIAWIMSIVAVSQFIAGAKLSNKKDLKITLTGEECYYLKPGMLSTAAFEALVNLVLTLFYYLVIASTQNVPVKPPGSELEAPSTIEDSKKPPLLP
ncbi:hypothetical protein L6452_31531 [Arctium lappa]|uniref:Uncharacterized protein n=1 Tax=Arctium lappa TaxID=4217 RepID=A0ACB8Z249_ARCLA|nr:hypothetical protein L6452_31531 [Arctium lappa]